MQNTLLIVIPFYNPYPGWENLLIERLKNFLNYNNTYSYKLCLVNDSTIDNITNEIEQIKSQLPIEVLYLKNHKNKGKGYSVRRAVAEIEADFYLYTDIDIPYTVDSMIAIVNQLNSNDVVIGVRDQEYYKNTPKSRTLVSKLLRWFLMGFLSLPVTDTQCGLKSFNTNGKKIFLKTGINRFLFDMEFIALIAKNKNVNLKTVDVSLRNDIVFSKLSFKIILNEFLNLQKIIIKRYL